MPHPDRPYPLLGLAFLLFSVLCSAAFGSENPSYAQFGHNINIGPNDKVGDLTCFGCSIHVHDGAEVASDVTTFGGSIVIDDQAQVAGDVTAFGGDIRLAKVRVAGDVTVLGGQIRRDPGASISGDVTSMGGRGWLVLIFLTPLLVLGLFIALIVWLVQRARRPSVPVAAA